MAEPLALVLFSGGQDSTTCLAWALDRFAAVESVGFDYGQRHRAEMDARQRILSVIPAQFPEWAGKLKDDHVLSLDVLRQIGGTALTDALDIEVREGRLPNTFVPGRNILIRDAFSVVRPLRSLRGAPRPFRSLSTHHAPPSIRSAAA